MDTRYVCYRWYYTLENPVSPESKIELGLADVHVCDEHEEAVRWCMDKFQKFCSTHMVYEVCGDKIRLDCAIGMVWGGCFKSPPSSIDGDLDEMQQRALGRYQQWVRWNELPLMEAQS